MELVNGTSLKGDNYKILSKISQGNFGITYLAEQTSLERKVCIKEFFFRGSCERAASGHVTVTSSGQDVTNSFRRKFMREAKRLSQFDHPNIVKVIEVFEENGTAYMVMDYVEGETLQQLVDRKGKLSEKEALNYIIPLCNALEVVHEKGLLHLDIKPSNILIKKQTNTPVPVLIDFGISKFTEASGQNHLTTTPVALTKGYAPLEQYGQDITKLTELSDVYAVAATLYKLVTGVTPPEASLIVQDGIKSPGELNPVLSDQLSSIILKSLSYKINDRAKSIKKLKEELIGISHNLRNVQPVRTFPPVKPGSDGETEVLPVEFKKPLLETPGRIEHIGNQEPDYSSTITRFGNQMTFLFVIDLLIAICLVFYITIFKLSTEQVGAEFPVISLISIVVSIIGGVITFYSSIAFSFPNLDFGSNQRLAPNEEELLILPFKEKLLFLFSFSNILLIGFSLLGLLHFNLNFEHADKSISFIISFFAIISIICLFRVWKRNV